MNRIGPRDAFAIAVNCRFFYGWLMIILAAVALFASGPGQTYTFSGFVTPISESLGLSRTSVSWAYGVATLVAALGMTGMGGLADRLGAGRVIMAAALLLGLTAMALSMIRNWAGLVVGFVLMRFLGQGALTLAPQHLVAQWFHRLRGRALSLAMLGASASLAVFPPITQWLIDLVGWRHAIMWLGVVVWALVLPLTWLVVQDRPERLGLKPDGDGASQADDKAGGGRTGLERHTSPAVEVNYTLRSALGTVAFWITAFAGALGSMLSTGLVFHQYSILELQGVAAQVSASVFPVTAASMVAGSLLSGWLLDRLPARLILCFGLLTLLASMQILLAAGGAPMAYAFGLMIGLSMGTNMTTGAYIWPTYFGRRHMGSIQGAARTIGHTGSAIGPILLAVSFDLLGSYDHALIGLSVLPLLFAVLVLFAVPPTRPDEASPAAGAQ